MQDEKMKRVGEGLVTEAIPSFLLKTYEILENPKYADIISWAKNGEGFIVKKVKEFAENILPIHFRHSNYTSFVRQLNMYDFHKTRQENQQNAFKNSMFRRGCKHLLKDIQRKDYKKNKENNKDVHDKPPVENKLLEAFRIDKDSHLVTDSQKHFIAKLVHAGALLENKTLILAELRELPATEYGVLKLLDLLFDLKDLNQGSFDKFLEFQLNWSQSVKKVWQTKQRVFEDKTERKQQFFLQSEIKTMANSGMKEEQCISIQCFEQEQYCTMKNEQVGTGTSLHGTMLFEDSIALE